MQRYREIAPVDHLAFTRRSNEIAIGERAVQFSGCLDAPT